MTSRVLALIPARAGSKGLPGKNKRPIGGKPLISYTIEAAKAARSLTDRAVSSDDPDILDIARASGVTAVARPQTLAQDDTPILPAIRHALSYFREEHGKRFDCIALLQPTSPLRRPTDIDEAVELFMTHRAPVCSVYRCEDNHPARMYRMDGNRLVSLMPEWATMRRQDLPAVYHRNGALYVFGEEHATAGAIIADPMIPYVMPAELSINVDTELDLLLVEAVLGRQ
jgi:N-acylneuraminate cytidylyltransferase